MKNCIPQPDPSASALNLEQISEQSGTQPLRRTALRTIGILKILDRFHSQGRLHLSVAPDSIIIESCGPDETVSLAAPRTSRNPGFSAPEIRSASRSFAGPAADLYSTAAVFHYSITGRPLTPFESIRPFPPDVTGCAALTGFAPPIRYLANEILRRGLSALPEKRYPNAGAMIADLELLIRLIDHPA